MKIGSVSGIKTFNQGQMLKNKPAFEGLWGKRYHITGTSDSFETIADNYYQSYFPFSNETTKEIEETIAPRVYNHSYTPDFSMAYTQSQTGRVDVRKPLDFTKEEYMLYKSKKEALSQESQDKVRDALSKYYPTSDKADVIERDIEDYSPMDTDD